MTRHQEACLCSAVAASTSARVHVAQCCQGKRVRVRPRVTRAYSFHGSGPLTPSHTGRTAGYVVDVDPKSFEVPKVARALSEAKTIFVNAVMGLTPFFFEGTKKMDEIIDNNKAAQKYYGAPRCGS
jgi:hypothetical protein